MVPIFLNTYYPPNQPPPWRCVDFGVAIGEAIRAFPGKRRVCLIGSGGLSHFVIDEELDRRVIDALATEDFGALGALPVEKLQSGSSEILNWITTGAAASGLAMELLAYVPGYRSLAGTGCGMAFATWSRTRS
jgi:hypothetical protein